MLTVKQLIEKLQALPEDAIIVNWSEDSENFFLSDECEIFIKDILENNPDDKFDRPLSGEDDRGTFFYGELKLFSKLMKEQFKNNPPKFVTLNAGH